VLYRRDAQLSLADCHEFDGESALRHTLRSVRLIEFVEMCIGKTGCPNTFGIAFASIRCRGVGRNGVAPEPKSGFQRK
jgi:hypothetical protein